MISVIITAYKEPKTVADLIRNLSGRQFLSLDGEFTNTEVEILQVSPDQESLDAGKKTAEAVKFDKGITFRQLKDQQKGKPAALNLAFAEAKGDILVMTDGDVKLHPGAVGEIVRPFQDLKIGGATGRPIVSNDRNSIMGYFGHFFTAAADKKRREVFSEQSEDNNYFYSYSQFFPYSGYLTAIRKFSDLKIPEGALVDDTYITHFVHFKGYGAAYTPNAVVEIKFPTTLRDYFVQRRRTITGHKQLKADLKAGGIDANNETGEKNVSSGRNLSDELKYVFFPLQFAKNVKELCWSLLIYPLRAATWGFVWWSQIRKTGNLWSRIESTK